MKIMRTTKGILLKTTSENRREGKGKENYRDVANTMGKVSQPK